MFHSYTRRLAAATFGAALLAAPGAMAQSDYPNDTIRMVVAYSPGGPNDLVARAYADKMSEILDTPMIVENHPGAAGNIGATVVVNAEPDGYTLFAGASGLTVSFAIRNLNYDVRTDLVPIGLMAKAGYLMAVNPDVPASSVSELIALAKEKPNGLKFGTSGVGTTPHLAWEYFMNESGIEMVHVPYKGLGQAITDLLSGEIDVMFVSVPVAVPHVESGALKGLAVTTGERNILAPDVPTIGEAALDGFEFASWWGVFAPKGTPDDVVAKLHDALVKAGASDDLQASLQDKGAQIVNNSPSELKDLILSDIEKFKKIAAAAGIEKK
jgi:tripartite-type tricarboxylate transporter receptor subunit TctC